MSLIIGAPSLHGGCFFLSISQSQESLGMMTTCFPSGTELGTEDAMMNKIGLALKDLADFYGRYIQK